MAYDVITPVNIAQAELTTSLTTVRTTPSGTRDLVKQIDIANGNSVAAQVTVHLVPDGGAPSAANKLFPAVRIPAETLVSWNGIHVLDGGATIQASATVSGVTIQISGGNAV